VLIFQENPFSSRQQLSNVGVRCSGIGIATIVFISEGCSWESGFVWRCILYFPSSLALLGNLNTQTISNGHNASIHYVQAWNVRIQMHRVSSAPEVAPSNMGRGPFYHAWYRLAGLTPDILGSCAALDDDDISVICALIIIQFLGYKADYYCPKRLKASPFVTHSVISLCPRILLFANLPSRSCLSPSVKTVGVAFTDVSCIRVLIASSIVRDNFESEKSKFESQIAEKLGIPAFKTSFNMNEVWAYSTEGSSSAGSMMKR